MPAIRVALGEELGKGGNMCFGSCRVTCDNCRPKFVYCPNCGNKCMLFHKVCKKCKTELTSEMKDAARKEWAVRAKNRHDAEVIVRKEKEAAREANDKE